MWSFSYWPPDPGVRGEVFLEREMEGIDDLEAGRRPTSPLASTSKASTLLPHLSPALFACPRRYLLFPLAAAAATELR